MSEKYSFIIYMLLFAGPSLLMFSFLYRSFIWHERKIIFQTMTIFLFFAIISDNIAIKTGVWGYGSNRILNLRLWWMPIEDLIFAAIVSYVVSSVTLLGLHFEQTGLDNKTKLHILIFVALLVIGTILVAIMSEKKLLL